MLLWKGLMGEGRRRGEWVGTFEGCLFGDVEGCVGPGEGVFCETAAGCVHFVECGYSVSGLEFGDGGAYGVDCSCYVVTLVGGWEAPF